jgi:hypothetical protein
MSEFHDYDPLPFASDTDTLPDCSCGAAWDDPSHRTFRSAAGNLSVAALIAIRFLEADPPDIALAIAALTGARQAFHDTLEAHGG